MTRVSRFRIIGGLVLVIATNHLPSGEPGITENSKVLGDYKYKSGIHEKPLDRLVVYYFGSSECPPCLSNENVNAIKRMKEELPRRHPDRVVSFVVAWNSHDVERSVEDVKKYGPWDEVMIGNHWHNEAFLRYLAGESNEPGIPHVMVFSDSVAYSKPERKTYVKDRRLRVDLLTSEMDSWLASGYSLSYRPKH